MGLLYVSDSPTVSGAELVLLGHVEAFRDRGDVPHVILKQGNRRLQAALNNLSERLTRERHVADIRRLYESAGSAF